ncbi:MAG TPA: hypothetical protein VFS92_09440, partial [Planctomycetota bacterium]|nr:hypothetical protein [Planctomycetota bacterium]
MTAPRASAAALLLTLVLFGVAPAAAPDSRIADREQFVEQVRAALRHYWGGPGLTHSGLLELSV